MTSDFRSQHIPPAADRRRATETDDLFSSSAGAFDPHTGYKMIKIFSGGWHVSVGGKEMLATILGSCVCACVRDPAIAVGGMNHFLLPDGGTGNASASDATRYGMFAMETLINNILSKGGKKERLEIKVFGGGNMLGNAQPIGAKNIAFIRSYLKSEGLSITSEDLGGNQPRRVHYFPDTGKVMLRKLRRTEDMRVVEEEIRYQKSIAAKPIEGDIDLF